MASQTPPLTTLPVRRRKKWLIVTLLLLIALFSALPIAMRLALEEFLPRLGIGQVDVEDIDFNPFAGTLALTNLTLKQAGRTTLQCHDLTIDLSMLALLKQRIDIEKIALTGLVVDIHQDRDTPLTIAGIPLPAGDTGTTTTDEAAASAWGIGWQAIVIRDITVHYHQDALSVDLVIANAYLDRSASWQAESAGHLQLDGRIAGADYYLYGNLQPFDPALNLVLGLQLERLAIGQFRELAPTPLTRLAGELSLSGKLRLSMTGQGPDIHVDGRTELAGLSLDYLPYLVRNERLAVTATISRQSSGDTTPQLNWQATIDGDHFSLGDDSRTITLERLSLAALKGAANGDIRLRQGRLANLAYRPGNDPAPITIADIRLIDVEHRASGGNRIHEIIVDGPRARVIRHQDGSTNLGVRTVDGTPPDSERTVADRPDDASTAAAPATRVIVDRIVIKNGLFTIRDDSVTPAYRDKITVSELTLAELDSAASSHPSPWSLRAGTGEFGKLALSGTVKPFSPDHDFSVLGTLRGLALPPVSGYSAMSIGYFIDSGQADADIDIKAEQGQLAGKIGLRLARLEVSAADEDKIGQLTSQLSMPLPSALAILRDDNDDISLSLPLKGDLDAPDFGIAPLINKLLGIALKKAAVGYLSNLLQPYATVLTVARLAIDMAGEIPLDPLPFAAGQAQLTEQEQTYIDKLGALLSERPALRLQLCGKAGMHDRQALMEQSQAQTASKEQETGPLDPQQIDERLLQLASARATTVKNALLAKGIDNSRLFLCRPQIDKDPEAVPRLELAL